jgi:hypothetical protein
LIEAQPQQQQQLSQPASLNGSELTAANQYKSAAAATFIDRHVLTENGVIPGSGPRAAKLWIERSSRSSKLTINYKFR